MFPRPMVYAMIVLSLCLLGVGVIAGALTANLGLLLSSGISLLLYLLIICCLRDKIETGIAFVAASTQFLSDKLYVLVTPVIKLALCSLVGVFYIYALSCIVAMLNDKESKGEDASMEQGFVGFFVFMWLLITFTLYYMMTFTIAVICSSWYYGEQRGSFGRAYRWLFTKQFGSIVFAAFTISIVTFLRMLASAARKETRNDHTAAKICLCLIECVIKCVEDLLKVLNHFSVIMLAITGESYVNSAKTTMGLLYRELAMLQITSMISNFLVFWGLLISVGIPSLLAYFLMTGKAEDDQLGVVGLVAVLSILMSMVIFEVIVESVGCIFIFYSLDRQFIQRGMARSSKIPQHTFNQINRHSVNPYGEGNENENGYNANDNQYGNGNGNGNPYGNGNENPYGNGNGNGNPYGNGNGSYQRM